jgi:hypothetical protein
VPLILGMSLNYGLGGKITNLRLGVINEEIQSYSECLNETLLAVDREGYDCKFERASCRFLNEIDDADIMKV